MLLQDPRFHELVAPDVTVQQVASGFGFTEGPVWDDRSGTLLFNDVPGNSRHQWAPRAGSRQVAVQTNYANGMAFDHEGRLLVCEHSTSRVVRIEHDGEARVLAATYGGKELNSPNDLIVDAAGQILFTDPAYGRCEGFGGPREPELPFQGVFRIDPAAPGEPQLLEDGLDTPNGLALGSSGSILYVADTERWSIYRYEVSAEGKLGQAVLFFEQEHSEGIDAGAPDGLKLDERENVWVTGPGGIWVVAPSGALLGRVEFPEVVGNFTWGGDDRRDLLACASTSVYRLRTRVRGKPLP
jgi:gluconolactonase